MKNMLYVVIGVIAIAVAIWEFKVFINQPSKNSADFSYVPIIIAAIGAIVALICGALFLSGRVNRTEEIHITE